MHQGESSSAGLSRKLVGQKKQNLGPIDPWSYSLPFHGIPG